MKQQRCRKENGYIPTFEEITENKHMIELCEYYGIRIGCFSDKGILTKDELQALHCILNHKTIPASLQNRLLSTKNQRAIPKSTEQQMTEDEAFALFGIQRA